MTNRIHMQLQSTSAMIGETISHYRVLAKIGDGRMGPIYKAQDLNVDRVVVLKFLHPDSVKDESGKARFLLEAKAASALDHPNVGTVYNLEQTERGQLFICMAYYEGETLGRKLDRGRMPMDEVADLATQIARGLSAVHQKGIIHRNIKPENIFVTKDGVAKILDFGMAKLKDNPAITKLGAIAWGSPAYMSPEQLSGAKVDHRTDIWSLGAVIYEMITGQGPFNAELMEAVAYQVMQENPPPLSKLRPDAPPKWEALVSRALAKKTDERYPQAEDLIRAVKATTQTPTRVEPTPAESAQPIGPSPEETSATPKVDMAYVLFTDLVGYSMLKTDQQMRLIKSLGQVVRETKAYKRRLGTDRLILLPTGDGMALVFFDNPIAPVDCAVQISRTLRAHPDLRLRMGIHAGPVYRTQDLNLGSNVAGGGVNLAQRVMDCGDAGHILISKTVAEVLGSLSEWTDTLHELGVQQVKHGVSVHLFNLYGSDFGNPEKPKRFDVPSTAARMAAKAPAAVARRGGSGKKVLLTILFLLVAAAATVVGLAKTGIMSLDDWKSLLCKYVPSAPPCSSSGPLPGKAVPKRR